MGKYINRLTDEDINNFLIQNNYSLCDSLFGDEGKPLPAISRSDEMIFLRCKRVYQEDEQEIDKQVAYDLYKKYKGFIMLSMLSRFGNYSTEIDLIALTDFDLCYFPEDIFQSHENAQTLYESYINFMLNKFKDENYREDLISDYESTSEPDKEL